MGHLAVFSAKEAKKNELQIHMVFQRQQKPNRYGSALA